MLRFHTPAAPAAAPNIDRRDFYAIVKLRATDAPTAATPTYKKDDDRVKISLLGWVPGITDDRQRTPDK